MSEVQNIHQVHSGANPRTWLTDRNGRVKGEWAYRLAERKLIAERRIGDPGEILADFKFYVFGGVTRLIHVDSDRFGEPCRSYYSPTWEPLPVHNGFPSQPVAKPHRLVEMIDAANAIGDGFDFMRVDLYLVGDTIWFGEVTPYPAGGLRKFYPHSFDEWLGGFWELPTDTGQS